MADQVLVSDMVAHTHLEVVTGGEHLDRPITMPDISRPGLAMTGYFNYYEPKRVQLFGINEMKFSDTLSHEKRTDVFNHLATEETPAFVVSSGLDIPVELQQAAEKAHIPVLTTRLTSSRILSNMTYYLGAQLSERVSVHGVLIDIHGLGVLVTGEAGVGKTEAALELIQQGRARLIADDRVDVYQEDEQRLVGVPAPVLRHMMEVRGIGIIDVMQTYGAMAIRSHATIAVNVHLQPTDKKDANFDRLGDQSQTLNILGIEVPKMIVPISPGRNTASVIDAAALKYRTLNMGYDPLVTLETRMTALMEENEGKDNAAAASENDAPKVPDDARPNTGSNHYLEGDGGHD